MSKAASTHITADLLMSNPRSLPEHDRNAVLAELSKARDGIASPAFEASLAKNPAASARLIIFLHETNAHALGKRAMALAGKLGVEGMVTTRNDDLIVEGVTVHHLQDHLNDQAVAMAELERAAEMAMTAPNAALELLEKHGHASWWVAHAIRHVATSALLDLMAPPKEFDVRQAFYRDLDAHLPGARKVRYSAVKGHIPDGFIEWRGSKMPVKIKRSVFDAKSLGQLQRYMGIYGAEHGIAAAPSLACDLPANVTFVAVPAGEAL